MKKKKTVNFPHNTFDQQMVTFSALGVSYGEQNDDDDDDDDNNKMEEIVTTTTPRRVRLVVHRHVPTIVPFVNDVLKILIIIVVFLDGASQVEVSRGT